MGCNLNTCSEPTTVLKVVALVFLWCSCIMIAINYYPYDGKYDLEHFMVITATGAFTIVAILIILRMVNKKTGKEQEAAFVILWAVFCFISAMLAILSDNNKVVEYLGATAFFGIAGVALTADAVFLFMKK